MYQLCKSDNRSYEFTVLINIYHVMNLSAEHGGLYRDLLETSMSKVISPSTKGHGKVRKHQQYIGACMTEVRKHHH